MSQTKRMSMTETLINTAIGFVISVATQVAVFPLFGIYVPVHSNVAICLIFTVISVVRSYVVRRAFNKLHQKGISL